MTLANIWFVLVAVLLTAYVVLDGFDLGAGVLYPFISRSEEEKRIVRASIGPVWDGNEVWLLTGAGAVFAAFPAVYAATFSGFYLAIMLVLFGLILRAVSLEFRHRDEGWKRVWDAFFFLGIIKKGPEDTAEMLEAEKAGAEPLAPDATGPAPAGTGR